MLGGIRLIFAAIQGEVPQLDNTSLPGEPEHLQKQALERGQVLLADVSQGAEIGELAAGQDPEGDVGLAPDGNLP